jgi:hypothetical protein
MTMSNTTTKKSVRINLAQRARLLQWCIDNCKSTTGYENLAVIASSELKFPITGNIMQNHWVATNGPRQVRKESQPLESVVADLVKRVAALERRPVQSGLNF